MDPWACCFHAQQAAEKALKAVLVAQGVEPPSIHNLVALPWLLIYGEMMVQPCC